MVVLVSCHWNRTFCTIAYAQGFTLPPIPQAYQMSNELSGNTTLSHYRIVSRLGTGGMGEVYLAQDTKLDRKVALKILPADVASHHDRMERFVREAKSAAALNQPNIAHVYEIGEADGMNFIAMEYVEGETLRALLSGNRPSLGRAVEFAAQISSGLAAAHCSGIVHRDIKPENLILTRGSQIKILDFGLAKLVEKQRATSHLSEMITVAYVGDAAHQGTRAGTILGTVSYMSPEQARGEEVDQSTDVFSLGTVLYEMLSGRRPFDGNSTIDTLHAIINQEPRPAIEVNPRLPVEVMEILGKALAKDVNERYQHVGDFELDLRRLKRSIETNSLLSAQTKLASKPRGWWTSKRAVLMWTALGVLLVVGGMVAAWMLGRSTSSPKHDVSMAHETLTPLTVDPGYDGEPTFSPDGQTIAYVSNRTGNFEIFRKQISGGAEINLTQNKADDVQP